MEGDDTGGRPSALVTGASRGIGYGIAAHLARTGWSLTLAARDPDALEKARARLSESGGVRVQAVAGDLSDEHTLEAVARAHGSTFGSLNALVLAAGLGSSGPIDGYPARRLDRQLAVNFRAPFILASLTMPLLRTAAQLDSMRGGRVVALGSMEGIYPDEGLAAYGASKAALLSLVRSINLEEGRHGVTASAVSPGYVDTDMSAWIADRIPPKSMITVADVVRVVDLILNLSRSAVIPNIVVNRAGASPYHA